MLNNIDPAQFDKGFEAGLNKMAYSWNDFKYNALNPIKSLTNHYTRGQANTLGIASKDDGTLDIDGFLKSKSELVGGSAADGALVNFQNRIGYDPNKGFGDNAMGMLEKNTGWDKTKGYGDNISNLVTSHPIMSAGIGAAGLYGGFKLGKGLGLFGGNNNNGGSQQQMDGSNDKLGPTPGPKNGFSAAYTTGAPRAPQALQKAGSSFNVTDGVRMNVSDLTLPSAFSAPAALGMNLVNMITNDESPHPQEVRPNQAINIEGHDQHAKELLAQPQMKNYIAKLMQRSYK